MKRTAGPGFLVGGSSPVVQSLIHVQLPATPWTEEHQAALSFTISQSLLKLMSFELVMPALLLEAKAKYSEELTSSQ